MSEDTPKDPKDAKTAPKASRAKRWLKRIALGVGGVLAVAAVGGGCFAYTQTSAYDESLEKVYNVAPLDHLARSSDPVVIERGKHLASSLGACAVGDCHGADLAAGKLTEAGPIGTMVAPNITTLLPAYSDGELARLVRHGLKKDGRTVRFMPANEWNWLPDSDVVAIVSYLRTVPSVDRPSPGAMEIRTLGKILDRRNLVPIDIARRIDHEKIEVGPPPTPTAEYGRYIARSCTGCHGEKMSGGPIPGSPPDFPTPLNLTPHETGLKDWSFEDFERLAASGTRKNGQKLASFMPIEAINNMDAVEKQALWAYLRSLAPEPFGNR